MVVVLEISAELGHDRSVRQRDELGADFIYPVSRSDSIRTIRD